MKIKLILLLLLIFGNFASAQSNAEIVKTINSKVGTAAGKYIYPNEEQIKSTSFEQDKENPLLYHFYITRVDSANNKNLKITFNPAHISHIYDTSEVSEELLKITLIFPIDSIQVEKRDENNKSIRKDPFNRIPMFFSIKDETIGAELKRLFLILKKRNLEIMGIKEEE